jgi:CheY-like chemotaxis protein
MGRILVVDDCPDAREIFALMVQQTGHAVDVAECGKRALDYLARYQPQLVFLDLHMPEVDGIQVLRAMRGDERLQHVPVVVISGASRSEIEKARREGATECYSKGQTTLNDILMTVGRYAGAVTDGGQGSSAAGGGNGRANQDA